MRAVSFAFAVAVASCSSTCAYEGSQDLPAGTDLHRFDPIVAYPAVLAAAGSGVTLMSIQAQYVREDGTQDLAATYIPSYLKEVTTYELFGPSTKPRDPSVPVGAGNEPFELVRVQISEPRWITVSKNGQKGGTQYKQLGMHVWRAGLATTPPGIPAPACSFAKLWTLAKTRGAPSGAVAEITYDSGGYRFKITGTPVSMKFDAACNPVP
jgi:hypothetical protein